MTYYNFRGKNGKFTKKEIDSTNNSVSLSVREESVCNTKKSSKPDRNTGSFDFFKEMNWIGHNPVYIGLMNCPVALKEEEWIDMASRFIEKEGSELFLKKMINSLKEYKV